MAQYGGVRRILLAQVLPFFAISIFLPLVLTKMNIQNPNASGVLYNVFTLIGVLVGLWIYGIATRRAYLLWTFYVSAAILTVMILWTSMSPLVALIMITAFAWCSRPPSSLNFPIPRSCSQRNCAAPA